MVYFTQLQFYSVIFIEFYSIIFVEFYNVIFVVEFYSVIFFAFQFLFNRPPCIKNLTINILPLFNALPADS